MSGSVAIGVRRTGAHGNRPRWRRRVRRLTGRPPGLSRPKRAFGYHGAIPGNLQGALLGHSLKTYGWIWLIIGVILIIAGASVLGPSDRPSAEVFRWVGIAAAALAAISAIFVMPYYPVWSLIYIAIAVMVIYGLSAHYSEQAA